MIEAEQQLKILYGVRVPFPDPRPTKAAKYTLAFSKPTVINVVGSYFRHTAMRVGETLCVDVAVTMPPVGCLYSGGYLHFLTLACSHCSRKRITSTIDTSIREPIT